MMDWKERIDKLSYKEMLFLNRFEPIGSPWFSGEIGQYFMKVMAKKRQEVGNNFHSKTSKELGWS